MIGSRPVVDIIASGVFSGGKLELLEAIAEGWFWDAFVFGVICCIWF